MKKGLLIWAIIFLSLVGGAYSETISSTPSVCCEKTIDGAFCINTNPEECADGFRNTPSSCSQTSYCRQGTCYDSNEGICIENVPQLVCNAQGGTWINKPIEQVEQCQLGCCIIADQAAFVSSVRCKRLSSFFGVSINFRNDIQSEVQCIATAQNQDKGACVYEEEFEKTCKFSTREECNAPDGIVNVNGTLGGVSTVNSSEKKFYKDYLCSADLLGTNCAKQASTTCYQGKVYWLDSCGNKENVYSSDKIKSWNNGKTADDNLVSSYAPLNNGNNKNNGNCDYLQGAVCAEHTGITGRPSYGDYYCKRTDCKDAPGLNGDIDKKSNRKNGESWCVYDSNVGTSLDTVGSIHYRLMCVDGEVKVEPCEDYRKGYGVCFQNEDIDNGAGGKFSTAACRVNRWEDCFSQTDEDECLDRDQRECIWKESILGLNIGASSSGSTSNTNTGFSNPTASPPEEDIFLSSEEENEDTISNRPDGICVPNYPPGLMFWESGESESICNQVSATCYVTYKKTLLGKLECVDNCDCLEESWALSMNQICTSVGDCGGYSNWLGKFTNEGYNWIVDGDERELSPNSQKTIISGLIGKTIGVDLVRNL